MILTVMAVKDVKVGLYQQPMFVPATGAGTRAFQDACTNPSKDNDISRHPSDFELYELGTYNMQNAQMKLHDTPTFIIGGANV